jgi:hypothetical protein
MFLVLSRSSVAGTCRMYTNTIVNICYTRRFGNWFHSNLQVTRCPFNIPFRELFYDAVSTQDGFVRNLSQSSRGITSKFTWKDRENTCNRSVRVAGVHKEIRPEHPPNTSLECHRYSKSSALSLH